MRSPNTWPGRFLSPGAVARAEREFFIAIVKQDIRMISHLLPGRPGVRHLSVVATLLLTASVYSQTDPGSLLDP